MFFCHQLVRKSVVRKPVRKKKFAYRGILRNTLNKYDVIRCINVGVWRTWFIPVSKALAGLIALSRTKRTGLLQKTGKQPISQPHFSKFLPHSLVRNNMVRKPVRMEIAILHNALLAN